jgi:hypothetical protein
MWVATAKSRPSGVTTRCRSNSSRYVIQVRTLPAWGCVVIAAWCEALCSSSTFPALVAVIPIAIIAALLAPASQSHLPLFVVICRASRNGGFFDTGA